MYLLEVTLLLLVYISIGVLPKSTNEEHIKENIKLDFDISEEDLHTLSTLNISHKYAWDPSAVA